MRTKKAIIIGAGPAGLTAAHEFLERTDITPIVLEMSEYLGGISRTVSYRGNRIDIGGHRFFSKSDRVMEWWLRRMPLQALPAGTVEITYQRTHREVNVRSDGPDPDSTDRVMLLRRRKSRIYFLRTFFDYPLRLTADTVVKLGLVRVIKIAFSYAWAACVASRHPRTLEEFYIGRFGRELYLTFFKSYTEKVWGVPCSQISAEWGAQRVKGLSISMALRHFAATVFRRKGRDLHQKDTETSLIEQFLYPKFGPGQMWEIIGEDITRRGGKVIMGQRVCKLHHDGNRITGIDGVDVNSGQTKHYTADYVLSSMPVKELIGALGSEVPADVRRVSEGLVYRDFMTVGLLLKRLRVLEEDGRGGRPITDNWIYIQEPDVRVGRLQVFNNWSPYMVADRTLTWVGLEYFCSEGDDLWTLPDDAMLSLAKSELARIGIIDVADYMDGVVIRIPKAYPAYFGTYDQFGVVRNYVDQFSNLYLIGRNGMHKYNNQDHSMLTAMTAVDNIIAKRIDKTNIWGVNTEQEYHEEK